MAEIGLTQSGSLKLPTPEEMLSKFPSQDLDKVCADIHLVELTRYIAEWHDLSPFLNLTPAEEREIESVFPPRTPTRQRIDALRKWRMKMGEKATYRYGILRNFKMLLLLNNYVHVALIIIIMVYITRIY